MNILKLLKNKRPFLKDLNYEIRYIQNLKILEEPSEIIIYNGDNEILRCKLAEKFSEDIAIVSLKDNYYAIYMGGTI